MTREVTTYSGVHMRLIRERGSAREHVCSCGEPAAEWAYDHTDPEERVDGNRNRPFSLDLSRYSPKCLPCHRRADKQDKCLRGHPLTGDNSYRYERPEGRSHRVCRTCARERTRARRAKAAATVSATG